jgi:hypothetical protein
MLAPTVKTATIGRRRDFVHTLCIGTEGPVAGLAGLTDNAVCMHIRVLDDWTGRRPSDRGTRRPAALRDERVRAD